MRKPGIMGTIALVVPLFVMLAAAAWYAGGLFSAAGPSMPMNGYLAMALGVVFSLVVGCGLMALLFYSSRHGYDEPYQADDVGEGGDGGEAGGGDRWSSSGSHTRWPGGGH